MEGCLELAYNDSLKKGMSIDENGKPGKMSVFGSHDIKKVYSKH